MKGWMILVLGVCATAGAADVTVYNSDLGLVREQRRFEFDAGTGTIRLSGVPARIDPSSVRLEAEGVTVLDQSFTHDLASSDRLLQRYIGREIGFERASESGQRETLRGTLLSVDGGRVLRSGGKLYVDPDGTPVLPEPAGPLAPTLSWTVTAKTGGGKPAEVSYLTAGMSWSADHVIELSAKEDRLDLTTWATVINDSGADFTDARLTLVAGDVNRAEPVQPVRFMQARKAAMATMAAAPDGVSQQPFSEYHLYGVAREVTLRNGEPRQIALASASGIAARKTFVYDPQGGAPRPYMSAHTRSDPGFGQGGDDAVWAVLEFSNGDKPLPKGRARMFRKDASGVSRFVGEDRVDHTPKNEKVRLKMGRAFDLIAERRQTSHNAEKRAFEESFEVTVTNRKDRAATVTAIERLNRWHEWKVTASSRPFRKRDAHTIEFEVPAPANGAETFTYTVRYTW